MLPLLSLAAQEVPEQTDEPVATLHAYSTLEEIPVLVLSSERKRLKQPLDEAAFWVSLDAGPKFHPTHVRMEIDDPLSISVLIDLTSPRTELLSHLAEALEAIAPEHSGGRIGTLQAHDRVSIYVLTCDLYRTVNDLPADGARLKRAVDQELNRWQASVEQKPAKLPCAKSVGLLDAMGFVTSELASRAGRRTMLVVTDGVDYGSHVTWKKELTAAQIGAVSVFGLMKGVDMSEAPARPSAPGASSTGLIFTGESGRTDMFSLICEGTGGMQIEASKDTMLSATEDFIRMLRERYVVEFPRSDALEGGVHSLDVTVDGLQAYIRAASLTVPIADKTILNDPATLKGDPATQPPIGTRRPARLSPEV